MGALCGHVTRCACCVPARYVRYLLFPINVAVVDLSLSKEADEFREQNTIFELQRVPK
jgi:hypothetical protein